MLKEELPAIICFALMAIIFLAAFWLDTRRAINYPVRPNRLASTNKKDRSASTTPSAEG